MVAVAQWLYQNVLGNLVASAITVGAAWFWKIQPHLHRIHAHLDAQREARDGG